MQSIEIRFVGGKKVEASWDQFRIQTDQPVDEGGEGSAPTPFSLFVASLGTCSFYYAMGFCQAREIPLEGLALREHLAWELTEGGKRRLAKVELELVVPPAFPEKYEKAILRAMDLCAVKKAILTPPEITLRASRG